MRQGREDMYTTEKEGVSKLSHPHLYVSYGQSWAINGRDALRHVSTCELQNLNNLGISIYFKYQWQGVAIVLCPTIALPLPYQSRIRAVAGSNVVPYFFLTCPIVLR